MNRKSESLILWLSVVGLSGGLLLGVMFAVATSIGLLGPAGTSCADPRVLFSSCLP